MKGILLSLGILIPTIPPSQIRLVPFPGIFSTYIGAHLSKRQFRLRPLSRGLFFNMDGICPFIYGGRGFSSPFLRTFFQFIKHGCLANAERVFVPFLGDFFSIARRSPVREGVFLVFVPFFGDFFSIKIIASNRAALSEVFVPFFGDFFSIVNRWRYARIRGRGFRPLFRGLFFNMERLF